MITGGQTGADRATLEAARLARVPTGGTAPIRFMMACGRDPTLHSLFRLVELSNAPNSQRLSLSQMYVLGSQRNVDDADATIAFRLKASVGTDKTIGYAIKHRRRRVRAICRSVTRTEQTMSHRALSSFRRCPVNNCICAAH